MRLYWKKHNTGLNLCVEYDEDQIFVVGGVRHTRRGGIEAMAKTMGYDPGRSERNLPSEEAAIEFVEMFQPWREFFPNEELYLEKDVVE